MIAYVFPGQGSQYKGMGGNIFNEFNDLTAKADEILGFSIKELCMEDSGDKLGLTQYTQPALYIVNALSYLKRIKDTGVKPDYVAGHSLGEYNALFAAGAYDFETGLKLVKKRGELMSQATKGGMAAVIGLSEEKVKEVLEKNNLQSIDIANYNTPSQIVISGHKEDIEKARLFFEAAEAMSYVVLKVSGAFHSRYMAEASKKFEEYLDSFTFSDLKIPVISNVYARPYKNNQIKKNLVEQIKNSVKWTDTIRYLMGKGEIEQIGPGMVLTSMIKSIEREAHPLIVSDEDWDKEEEGVSSFYFNAETSNCIKDEKN
ncbi:ACP S-malonyltransferase [Clostridium formicaceticum]|uniref:Malonyl CoA-acyl carrier protein transacylase n=1 Tax=Clostridium formicaceticum TaxID=1497 RepID=A0AAC9RIF6_9CLOT|nr:ACP S-malonyltransferase [Clostridium formicaceticum]ARE86636.1 Polyketide biosynthesis malonyl CoA-acyl carrier protein transacylase BaeC [Clostridium formicaceticum]